MAKKRKVKADKMAIRRVLCGDDYLHFTTTFRQVDYFFAQSPGNTIIKSVSLSPYDTSPGNYELWDTVGQGVRNLKSLRMLMIYLCNIFGEPDWKILARILLNMESKIDLRISGGSFESIERVNGLIEGAEEMRAFSRAIQGKRDLMLAMEAFPLKASLHYVLP